VLDFEFLSAFGYKLNARNINVRIFPPHILWEVFEI
jgi:hypothetical protein